MKLATAATRPCAGRALRGLSRPVWWRLQAGDRRWLAGTAGAVALLGVVAGLAWHRQSSELASAAQALAAAEREQAMAQDRSAQSALARAAQPLPWWAQLPAAAVRRGGATAAQQLSADALALAPQLGVRVLRLTMAPVPSEAGAPYRSSAVQVELTGPYAEVKRWLAELLARRPHALVLRSLDMRKAAAAEGGVGQGIEATIELRLFERVSAQAPAVGSQP